MPIGRTPGAIVFRYVKDRLDDKIIPRPRLEIRLRNGEKTFRVAMLVDSGADISFISFEIADILGLKLSSETFTSRSASGSFETRRGTVYAELMKGSDNIALGEIPVSVPAKPSADPKYYANYALLGRTPFFKKFDVTFRENIQKLILRRPKRT